MNAIHPHLAYEHPQQYNKPSECTYNGICTVLYRQSHHQRPVLVLKMDSNQLFMWHRAHIGSKWLRGSHSNLPYPTLIIIHPSTLARAISQGVSQSAIDGWIPSWAIHLGEEVHHSLLAYRSTTSERSLCLLLYTMPEVDGGWVYWLGLRKTDVQAHPYGNCSTSSSSTSSGGTGGNVPSLCLPVSPPFPVHGANALCQMLVYLPSYCMLWI